MKKICLSMLICCTSLMPLKVQASEVYKVFTAKRFDMYLDTKYFKTVSNFGQGGDKQSLAANSVLQSINLQTSARYLFFNDVGFYTGLNFNNIETHNGFSTRTNSLLTHFFTGADYQFFHSEKWVFYADFSYFISNEKIDLNQDNALASDGANIFKASVVGVTRSESVRSFAKLGADYRSEGLSSLLIYGFGGELLFGNSALGAEFEGSSTIKEDQNTNAAQIRETLTNRVNAGSLLYYSVNPNVLGAQLYYSYAFDPNSVLKLNAGTTVLGSNSADGYHAGLSFNWGFGGYGNSAYGAKQYKKMSNKSSVSDEDPGFKIDTSDGVNQDLFKPAVPVKPKK